MMNRRLRRLTKVDTEAVRYFGSPNADLVLLAFGTTLGAAKEAQPIIEEIDRQEGGRAADPADLPGARARDR